MARIRTIKPEFPQSESMGRVSRDARLTFVTMWTLADDSGRLRGNSRMLASLLFPYDDDAPGLISTWLEELEREHCIVRYESDGSSYVQIVTWKENQKIDKPSPSKIPPPPEKTPPLANIREHSRERIESSRMFVVGEGEEGKGEEGKGMDQGEEGEESRILDPGSSSSSPDFIFECSGDPSSFTLSEGDFQIWEHSYQSIDVRSEVLKARANLLTTGEKRTMAATRKYLNNWLQNARPKGTRDGPNGARKKQIPVGKDHDPNSPF